LYFVVNRRLDRSPQPDLEIDWKHLLDESQTLLDKTTETDEGTQELMQMTKVVLSQISLLYNENEERNPAIVCGNLRGARRAAALLRTISVSLGCAACSDRLNSVW
jgi:hypothetical protein